MKVTKPIGSDEVDPTSSVVLVPSLVFFTLLQLAVFFQIWTGSKVLGVFHKQDIELRLGLVSDDELLLSGVPR